MGQVDDEDYERKQPQDLQAMLVQGNDRGGKKVSEKWNVEIMWLI